MANKSTTQDRGESAGLMEPLLISQSSHYRPELTDLAFELVNASTGFRRSLPDGVARALSGLVRAMNCYYSNLIEGHDTHPVDIERALNKEFSTDPQQRNLQLEAASHIAVQQWIDEGGLTGHATSAAGILEIHKRFCELLPPELLVVKHPLTKELIDVIPGAYRRHDVEVGRHVPVSPGVVPRFMERFEQAYRNLGKAETILASAAAHHRLLWIHPFLDGNGRVARLMSYTTLLETLDTGGIWSIARGLARNDQTYKQHLTACDLTRRNDLDGRGHLSEESLAQFTKFFLETCIDQVRFMEALVQPDRLRARIMLWAEEEARISNMPAKAGVILEAILFRGELPRADVAALLDTSPRTARRVVSALMNRGVIAADTPKAHLHMTFPAALASRWMPGLFPEK